MKLKLAANTLYQIIGKVISAGSTLLIVILITRSFGTQGYGDFEKITSFVAIFYLFADFGLNAVALIEIKKDETKRSQIFFHVLFLRFVISLVLIFITLALLSFLPFSQTQGFTPFVRLGIIIASLTILTQSLFTTANLLFQESLRYDKSVIASSVSSLLNLSLVYIVTLKNLPLLFVILSFLISGIAQMIISLFLSKSYLSPISFTSVIKKEKLLALLKQSLPLGITLVFNVVYFRSDIVLLTLMKSTDEVAYYGLAYRFFEFVLVFPTFFNNALYPLLLEAQKENFLKLKKMFFASAAFLFGIGLIAGIFLFILSPSLINLTSSKFTQSIISLKILSLSLPVFFLTSLFMWFLVSRHRQKVLAPIYGISMVVNIILNLIFIPKYSFIASSFITVVTEILVLIFLFFAVKKELYE